MEILNRSSIHKYHFVSVDALETVQKSVIEIWKKYLQVHQA